MNAAFFPKAAATAAAASQLHYGNHMDFVRKVSREASINVCNPMWTLFFRAIKLTAILFGNFLKEAKIFDIKSMPQFQNRKQSEM